MNIESDRKLLFIVNVDWFFTSHRLPIARAALAAGYEVHLATRVTTMRSELEGFGIRVHDVPIKRSGMGVGLVYEIFALNKIIKQVSPTLVHLVTIKPVLLGGLVCRLRKVRGVVFSISGLGTTFSENSRRMMRFTRLFTSTLYYFVLGHKNSIVIFQNIADFETLKNINAAVEARHKLIPGSGVDLQVFGEKNLENKNVMVMMAARLLISKGVLEFGEAARIIKRRLGQTVRFVLVGEVDKDNPEAVSQDVIQSFEEDGLLEIWGHKSEMQHIIPMANIVVLPSYYGEGLPKILIEAAACGRAVVTTDHPGCRDAVTSETGLLVPIRDSVALAEAIVSLILDDVKCMKMGRAARLLAHERYSIEHVCDTHLDIYEELRLGVH